MCDIVPYALHGCGFYFIHSFQIIMRHGRYSSFKTPYMHAHNITKGICPLDVCDQGLTEERSISHKLRTRSREERGVWGGRGGEESDGRGGEESDGRGGEESDGRGGEESDGRGGEGRRVTGGEGRGGE